MDSAFRTLELAPPGETIPLLAALLWDGSPSSGRLHKFFLKMAERLPGSSWPQVEESVRRQLSYLPDAWNSSPHWLGPGTPALVLIGLCHPSGHVREKAVRLSSGLDTSLEASLLLIRVNDWVAPVRDAAVARMTTILESLDPVRKITLLPLLSRLRECGRHGQHRLLAGWMKGVASNFDEASWLAAWHGSTGRDRRSYLDALRISGQPPGGEIRQALIESNDRRALNWLIREVTPTLHKDEREKLILAVRKSRAVVVRREWLNHCIGSLPPAEVDSILKEAMLDRSRGIRQFARFQLATLSPVDFTAFYQNALSNPATEAAALCGLSEVDPAEAHKEAIARLESGVPAVLKAALESLAPESLGDFMDVLIDRAGSRMPGVPKAARKRLTEIRRLLGTDLVARPEIWDRANDSTRTFFIRKAPYFQKWDGLEFLLIRAAQDGSRNDLLPALMMWRARERGAFSKLPPARREKLLAILDRAELPSPDKESLRFIITHAE